jgi:hypothetical protein
MGAHGEVQQSIRGSEDGGIMDEGFQSVAKGFRECETVLKVQIQFQRRSWGFGWQMGGGMVVQ